MSALSEAWIELYAAQTEAIGTITATIEGVAEAKRCIPVESPWNRVNADDGGGKEWDEDREVQMLYSDFSGPLYQFMPVTVSDDMRPCHLEGWRINNGIAYLRLKFIGTGYEAGAEIPMAGDETIFAGGS